MRLRHAGMVRGLASGMMGLTLVLLATPALASLSQGFATATPIATGSLVSLDPKSSGSVVVADLNNAARLFGVAVAPASADISLGSGDGQIQVATTGSAATLVSTAGGNIKVGDAIAVSSVAGVGQKAVGKSRVIGTAQADFAGGDGSTRRTVDTGSGNKEVFIGQVPIVIAVTTYIKEDSQTYTVPNWLQRYANVLAGGRDVSPVRIIIAALILLVSLISVTVLLYAAVRNSIISIGRNPLSRGSVFKGLIQVVVVAAIILGVAIGAMFLIITR